MAIRATPTTRFSQLGSVHKRIATPNGKPNSDPSAKGRSLDHLKSVRTLESVWMALVPARKVTKIEASRALRINVSTPIVIIPNAKPLIPCTTAATRHVIAAAARTVGSNSNDSNRSQTLMRILDISTVQNVRPMEG